LIPAAATVVKSRTYPKKFAFAGSCPFSPFLLLTEAGWKRCPTLMKESAAVAASF
jgi:hypothetical protein